MGSCDLLNGISEIDGFVMEKRISFNLSVTSPMNDRRTQAPVLVLSLILVVQGA
jgi:hypothetical protein